MNLRPSSRFPALSPRTRLALEFLLYAVLTAIMLHATWLTWPDAFIDFSRELYLPWRVSQGDLLYRDLAFYYGPVSVHLNAALFAFLGHPSVQALFVLNFAFWGATLLALRALLLRIASPLAAILAVSSFILLFSFSRYTGIGNYNFLAPYSHELTRGFFFALLALLSLNSAFCHLPDTRPASRISVRFLLPGSLYALVLFTKPEIALAASASLALLFTLHALRRRSFLLRPLFAFTLAAIATASLVVAPFAIAFHSIPTALHYALFKLYLDCLLPSIASTPYFQGVRGTDHILAHSLRLFLGAFLALLPIASACILAPRVSRRHLRLLLLLALPLFAAAIGWFAFFPLNAALPLAPLALLALCWRHGCPARDREAAASTTSPLSAAFALFALFLTLKIFLNAGIGHYGFVLALSAFCCSVVLAFPPNAPLHRCLPAAALLAAFTACALRICACALSDQRSPIHDASYLASPLDARAFNTALDWIRNNTPPGSTLAVFPEGAILNVFANRPNSTPFICFRHEDLLRYDTHRLLDAFRATPPDTIVLLRADGRQFGTDYAQDLMAFLDAHYSPVLTVPLQTPARPVPYLLVARRN